MLLAVLDTNWQMEVQCQTNTTWKLSNCISDSDVLNRRVLFHQNRQHQKAGAQLWWDQTRQSAARSQHSVQGSWPTSHDLAVSDTAHPDIHTHSALSVTVTATITGYSIRHSIHHLQNVQHALTSKVMRHSLCCTAVAEMTGQLHCSAAFASTNDFPPWQQHDLQFLSYKYVALKLTLASLYH